ncbi:hypothetical protein GQ54DRAFT_299876 [Martensiomyces pterosporus]|nr:hypothetical protein GQ54DRAFT_299876 [Martensiomyces pterosporus]
MLPESIAQNLPPHLIECILNYECSNAGAARKSMLRLCPARDMVLHSTQDEALLPFTNLCRKWRAVAVSLYYRTGTITCMRSPDSDAPYMLNTRGVLSVTTAVTLSIPAEVIVDGDLHAIMEGPPLANAVFASVSWLKLQFGDDEIAEYDLTTDLVERLKYFSTQLRRLFPNVSTITYQDLLGFCISPEFAKLAVEEIVKLVWLPAFYGRGRPSDLVGKAPAVGLTSIRLLEDIASHEFMELVRRNTPTLVDLYISSMFRNVYKHVVLDLEGAAVVYPKLERFETSAALCFETTESVSLSSPEGVPFPVLKYLSVMDGYSFSNDVFFRGNSATLEYLALGLTPSLLEVIETHHLFRPNSYPQLQYLNFASGFLRRPATEQEEQTLLRIPFNLGPNLQVAKIGIPIHRFGSATLDCVRQSVFRSGIQHLDIGSTSLSLIDTIGLVKLLPSLTMLWCGLKAETEGQAKYLRAKDVKQLYADHFPVRSRLQHFKTGCNTRRSLQMMGELVCMFAVLVPSVYRISCENPFGHHSSYICELGYKQRAFKGHADRFDGIKFG